MPNKLAAPNPALASHLQVRRHWRGIGELRPFGYTSEMRRNRTIDERYRSVRSTLERMATIANLDAELSRFIFRDTPDLDVRARAFIASISRPWSAWGAFRPPYTRSFRRFVPT